MAKVPLPEKLFRYRPILTSQQLLYVISEIKECNLYLSRPEDFNDIFDAVSILSKENLYEYFKESSQLNEIISLVNRVYEIYGNTSTHDDVERLKNVKMDFWVDTNNHYNQILGEVRVACFTESHQNMPMWAHYANNHQGVCLQYNPATFLNAWSRERLFSVKYTKQMPDIISEILLTKKRKITFKTIESIVTKKHEDWRYEKEWRLILHKGHFYSKENDVPKEFYKFGKLVVFEKPSKVYLGYKVSTDVEELFRSVLENTGVEIVKMEMTAFGLFEKRINAAEKK